MGDAGPVVSLRREAGRTLHVLTGCTAVGKSEWAVRWAEANSAEIISCDSLLFYRGMDIGTAKPTREERGRVPHHLIDIRDVAEPMNAALYASMAFNAAEEIAARGRPILVVGGSGFYLRSFFAPIADGLHVPPETRARVAAMLESGGLPALVGELGRLNPGGLGGLDTSNPRRVASALGRCLASGRTLAELSLEFARAPFLFAGWEVRLARLDRKGPELDARIASRVEAMLNAGLVGEVTRLLGTGLRSNPSAACAIGYRETIDVLEGRAAMDGLTGAIARDTRALVKKQRTWFRTQLPPHPVLDAAELGDAARLFLR
jgi:tRNA dimethylallyltransferase